MTLAKLLLIASGLRATVYGVGESNCGQVADPQPCVYGAVTASGETFDPGFPSAAVAAPTNFHFRGIWIGLRVNGGGCHWIRLNDKSNPRWIGKRGFDLSPAAVQLLTGREASPYWSGVVFICRPKEVSPSSL